MPLVRVTVKGDEKVKAELAALRKSVRRDTRDVIRAAVDQVAVPAARRRAPSIVAVKIVAFSTGSGGGIRVAGGRRIRRIAGLLEWGGTVSAPITPRRKRARGNRRRPAAVSFTVGGRQITVARITTPRTYRGQHYMQKTVTSRRVVNGVLRQLARDLPKAMARHTSAEVQ